MSDSIRSVRIELENDRVTRIGWTDESGLERESIAPEDWELDEKRTIVIRKRNGSSAVEENPDMSAPLQSAQHAHGCISYDIGGFLFTYCW